MRGKSAKRLRLLAAEKHLQMLGERSMPVPTNLEEAKHQRRAIYLSLKRRWKKSSNPKSLLYVDLTRPSRLRLQTRLVHSGHLSLS